MSDELKITKGHIIAGIIGAFGGGLFVYGITKWLPEFQEKVTEKIVEKFSKRGIRYEASSDIYSLKSEIERMNERLENLERILREYKGA